MASRCRKFVCPDLIHANWRFAARRNGRAHHRGPMLLCCPNRFRGIFADPGDTKAAPPTAATWCTEKNKAEGLNMHGCWTWVACTYIRTEHMYISILYIHIYIHIIYIYIYLYYINIQLLIYIHLLKYINEIYPYNCVYIYVYNRIYTHSIKHVMHHIIISHVLEVRVIHRCLNR